MKVTGTWHPTWHLPCFLVSSSTASSRTTNLRLTGGTTASSRTTNLRLTGGTVALIAIAVLTVLTIAAVAAVYTARKCRADQIDSREQSKVKTLHKKKQALRRWHHLNQHRVLQMQARVNQAQQIMSTTQTVNLVKKPAKSTPTQAVSKYWQKNQYQRANVPLGLLNKLKLCQYWFFCRLFPCLQTQQ